MSLFPNHYMYVFSAPCVCIYELYVLPVSAWERGRMCECVNVKSFKISKLNVMRCNCVKKPNSDTCISF